MYGVGAFYDFYDPFQSTNIYLFRSAKTQISKISNVVQIKPQFDLKMTNAFVLFSDIFMAVFFFFFCTNWLYALEPVELNRSLESGQLLFVL